MEEIKITGKFPAARWTRVFRPAQPVLCHWLIYMLILTEICFTFNVSQKNIPAFSFFHLPTHQNRIKIRHQVRRDLSKEIPQSHVLRELPNRTERLPTALPPCLFFFPAFHAFQTVFQEPTVAVDVPFRCFGIIRSGENIPDISHIRSGKEAGTGFPDSGIWS